MIRTCVNYASCVEGCPSKEVLYWHTDILSQASTSRLCTSVKGERFSCLRAPLQRAQTQNQTCLAIVPQRRFLQMLSMSGQTMTRCIASIAAAACQPVMLRWSILVTMQDAKAIWFAMSCAMQPYLYADTQCHLVLMNNITSDARIEQQKSLLMPGSCHAITVTLSERMC